MEWLRSSQQRREFERLVAEATEGLRRTAYLMTWDAQEADDLVQVTWATVARRWPRVSQMENPVAYARRVLTNAAIDGRVHRQRRRQELAAADGDTRDVVDVASGMRMPPSMTSRTCGGRWPR